MYIDLGNVHGLWKDSLLQNKVNSYLLLPYLYPNRKLYLHVHYKIQYMKGTSSFKHSLIQAKFVVNYLITQ